MNLRQSGARRRSPTFNAKHTRSPFPEGNEVLLGTILRKDSQLVNCVLVAVGDALAKQEGM
jgi:hypothetical protein